MPKLTFSGFIGLGRISALAVLLIGIWVAPLSAQQADTTLQDDQNILEAQQELLAIQSSISMSRERANEMRAEISEMYGDRARQNAALIAAAQRVKLAEIETAAAEERLAELLITEKEIRSRLEGADANVTNLLAALQRLSHAPPPVLLVSPNDAAKSARSGTLLAAILPQLRDKAGSVTVDLQNLLSIRQTVEEEEETLRANLTVLFEEQLRTATLIEARRMGAQKVSSKLVEEEQQAQELAERANSLGDLIKSLKENVDSVSAATDEANQIETNPAWVNMTSEDIVTALAKTDRRQPAIPFAAARGYLTLPASGVVTGQFGADDGFGGISKGISLVTRAEAQVVAPSDGWVVYKGPYLNYGQIIILNPGQGYSILLAGLEKTNVELGQFVMMGEPMGFMGSRTIGQAVTSKAGVSRPTLYIELREQDTPLNPLNWWAEKNSEIQSG